VKHFGDVLRIGAGGQESLASGEATAVGELLRCVSHGQQAIGDLNRHRRRGASRQGGKEREAADADGRKQEGPSQEVRQ